MSAGGWLQKGLVEEATWDRLAGRADEGSALEQAVHASRDTVGPPQDSSLPVSPLVSPTPSTLVYVLRVCM